jgi:hypothetical protein
MSQKPLMWNRNNPFAYSDPSGFDPYIIFDPNSAYGNGHVSIAIITPKTGAGTVYAQGPPHGEFGFVRQIATAHTITMGDVGKLARDGKVVLSEHTTASQDNAMRIRGNAAVSETKNYNAITCNCDQFVKNILSAGDPAAANVLHLVPRDDVVNLISEGFRSGHPGLAPNGFKNVTHQVIGK